MLIFFAVVVRLYYWKKKYFSLALVKKVEVLDWEQSQTSVTAHSNFWLSILTNQTATGRTRAGIGAFLIKLDLGEVCLHHILTDQAVALDVCAPVWTSVMVSSVAGNYTEVLVLLEINVNKKSVLGAGLQRDKERWTACKMY